MSRLTRYHQESLLTDEGGYYESDNSNYLDITNKLGKLEDIEDELGCPLDVVFKAARNGFWFMSDKFWKNVFTKQFSNIPILFYHYEYECFCFEVGVSGVYIPLKDYKKTWWLKEDMSE